MHASAQAKAARAAKDQTILVPGCLLLFVSSEAAEPHLNLRLPRRDLLAGVMSALRRDSGGDVCVADRFISALEYANNPAHVFALFANYLSNVARGVDQPAPPAESPMTVDQTVEWYALPMFFFASYSQIPEIKEGVVELRPKTVEAIDAMLRAVIGPPPCRHLEFPPVVMHRALVPAFIEGRTVTAIKAVAEQGKLREIPSPLPDEVFQMAQWPLYLTMPTKERGGRPLPEVRLSRDTDPETVARIEAAGWRVRFPKVLRLVR